jgi:hypothetical protein
MSAESMCWVMYSLKKVILCLFYASEQSKVLKKSHCLLIFAHLLGWGAGGAGCGQGATIATKQRQKSSQGKNATNYSPIISLTENWRLFAFSTTS